MASEQMHVFKTSLRAELSLLIFSGKQPPLFCPLHRSGAPGLTRFGLLSKIPRLLASSTARIGVEIRGQSGVLQDCHSLGLYDQSHYQTIIRVISQRRKLRTGEPTPWPLSSRGMVTSETLNSDFPLCGHTPQPPSHRALNLS